METVIISSDNKFEFISRINFSKKVLYKNDTLISNLKENINYVSEKLIINNSLNTDRKTLYIAIIILGTTLSSLLYSIL